MQLTTRRSLILFLSALLVVGLDKLMSNDFLMAQPCTVNDDCSSATFISNIISDQSFVCINGCNLDAAPDNISACMVNDYPSVWYTFQTDDSAGVLNIEVHSSDFESPMITLYQSFAGCSELSVAPLSNSNLTCIIGTDGVAKAIGTEVYPGEDYYIQVSSYLSVGGNFEICVSSMSDGSTCVVSRDLEIVARSNGGSLEGPFDPAETVSVCMNVNSFTAVGNGCQWFQGIVPVFGNGWDPASFDVSGQPINATLNNEAIGVAGNGIYGPTTWDWLNNVGYHHPNERLQIGDFDANGRIDMCNSVYEVDCPYMGGVLGGCCGPCWDSIPSELLPGGWYAYGINGTCAFPGPPIAVDWGDGNTCGGGMGSWSFCFDLVTRDTPDCLGDSTKKDLTLGYYTFADGEIGSWTGNASVCALDQPVKMSFRSQCGKVTTNPPVQLNNVCSGNIFTYKIEAPGITSWEWNISPYAAVPYEVNNGPNGFVLEVPVNNPGPSPLEAKGIFIGRITGSEDVVIRKIYFTINPCPDGEDFILPYEDNEEPPIHGVVPPVDHISGTHIAKRSTDHLNDIRIYPSPANEKVYVEWPSHSMKGGNVILINAAGIKVSEISVSAEDGNRKAIDISHLATGLYVITFQGDDFHHVSKVVKL